MQMVVGIYHEIIQIHNSVLCDQQHSKEYSRHIQAEYENISWNNVSMQVACWGK